MVVEDWERAALMVRAGVDSSTIVVASESDRAAALERARAGVRDQRGPLPLTPHASGYRCLVVLPTYNESENVEQIASDILAYLETDLLIVDDNSPDGTGQIADRLAATDSRIHVIHRAGKQGLGTAYLAGFAHAIERGYERVFEMDADFSHPPWDLPRLVEATRTAQLSIGSRYVPGGSTIGWDLKRRLLSRGANLYARTILGLSVRDATAGFRCYDVAHLARLDLGGIRAEGYAFQIEMVYRIKRAGGAISEVPIHFTDRRLGASKMSAKVAREAVLLVPTLRWRVRHSTLWKKSAS